MEEPTLIMCDNCGTENPGIKDGTNNITTCCGYGLTGYWEDGWGKRMLIKGQSRIDWWRMEREIKQVKGELPKAPYSAKGHYEI